MTSKKSTPTHTCLFYWFPLIFCLFLMVLPMGCKQEQAPLKIGFSGCMTGQLADLGIAGRNAVMLAVEEINAAGGINGRMVELIVKDDANTPETALTVDQELIDAGVVAIIGHMTSSMSITAVPMMNENKVVMLSPTSTTNLLSGKDDYFFRITSPDKIQSDIMANHAFNTLNLKRIACVYDLSNQGFTQGWLNNFRTIFEEMGGHIVYEAAFHSREQFSYLTIANQILASGPDGILILSGALHTAMFCQQIRKKDTAIPVIASGWVGTPELIQQGGSSVEGISFPQVFNQESRHPRYLSFKQKHMDRFKKEPNFASMCSYESAGFLFAALTEWDGKSPLKSRVIHQGIHEGLQGEIRMNSYGDASRSQFIITVRDGRFSILETKNP